MAKHYNQYRDEVIKKFFDTEIKEGKAPDMAECKILWKIGNSREGEVANIRIDHHIYDAGFLAAHDDFDEEVGVVFNCSTLNDFASLIANLSDRHREQLKKDDIDYSTFGKHFKDWEWGDGKEDFVILEVLNFWNSED